MKKILLVLIVILLILTSCNGPKKEYSDVLKEQATIVNIIYTPSQHSTYLSETMIDDHTNLMKGVDMNGNSGIKIGNGIQVSESNIPEKYGVVFQCQHGTFTIQGNNKEGENSKYKILYDKLKNNIGDTVHVLYKEEYLVYYEKDKNRNKIISKKVLNDLDFIDAQLIK